MLANIPPPNLGGLTPFSLGARVRLHGLKSVSLNNKCGFIVELINKSGRYGVNILGECLPKAILPTNLTNYHPLPDDRCCLCDEWFNLNSLPSCSCRQTCAPEDEDGGKDMILMTSVQKIPIRTSTPLRPRAAHQRFQTFHFQQLLRALSALVN